MKVLTGVAAVLFAAVLGLAWLLKEAWQDATVARNEALQALQVAGEQRQQAELLLRRFDALDTQLGVLAGGIEANDRRLGQALDQIGNIVKTEEDSDESIACLGVPVPRQLDDILR